MVKDKIQGSALVSGLFFSTLIETLFLNQMWFYKNNNYKVIKKENKNKENTVIGLEKSLPPL